MEKKLRSHMILPVLVVGIALAGCKQTMVISKVDYSQPVETVLEPDDRGMVNDVMHGLKFSILPLQYAETSDTSSVTTDQVRMIRGKEGFYYITAPSYSNVYVMAPEEGELKLKKKIKVAEEGIAKPAFNQRDPNVQLVNRKTGEIYAISVEGVNKVDENQPEQEADHDENNSR